MELSAPLTAVSQVQFHCNTPNEVGTAAGWSTGLCSAVSLPTLGFPIPVTGVGLCPTTRSPGQYQFKVENMHSAQVISISLG